MPGEKGSKAQVQSAINQIAHLLIRGIHRRCDILRYIREMDALPAKQQKKAQWVPIKKSEQTIDIYIARARQIFKEETASTREEFRALYTTQLEDLYRLARAQGKIQTANQIMKSKIYLCGLGGYRVDGEISINNGYREKLKGMSTEDIIEEIERLQND